MQTHCRVDIMFRVYVTEFAKTQHNPARTEIHFIALHESHTLALSRHTNDRAKDSQICFHRQHFSDPVNPWHWGALIRLHSVKLLPTTVLAWQVHFGYFCVLLNIQWLCPCAHGWFNSPSASHHPHCPHPLLSARPHPLPPAHLLLYLIHDIGGVQEKLSQNPAVLAR